MENIQQRFEERKAELIALGATHNEDERGFIFGDCFIDDTDILNGDAKDFEQAIELVKMEAWSKSKNSVASE